MADLQAQFTIYAGRTAMPVGKPIQFSILAKDTEAFRIRIDDLKSNIPDVILTSGQMLCLDIFLARNTNFGFITISAGQTVKRFPLLSGI